MAGCLSGGFGLPHWQRQQAVYSQNDGVLMGRMWSQDLANVRLVKEAVSLHGCGSRHVSFKGQRIVVVMMNASQSGAEPESVAAAATGTTATTNIVSDKGGGVGKESGSVESRSEG